MSGLMLASWTLVKEASFQRRAGSVRFWQAGWRDHRDIETSRHPETYGAPQATVSCSITHVAARASQPPKMPVPGPLCQG